MSMSVHLVGIIASRESHVSTYLVVLLASVSYSGTKCPVVNRKLSSTQAVHNWGPVSLKFFSHSKNDTCSSCRRRSSRPCPAWRWRTRLFWYRRWGWSGAWSCFRFGNGFGGQWPAHFWFGSQLNILKVWYSCRSKYRNMNSGKIPLFSPFLENVKIAESGQFRYLSGNSGHSRRKTYPFKPKSVILWVR